MSVRVNLAPEVYQNSQRNQQRKRLATTIGIAVSAVSVGFVIVGLIVVGGEKLAIKALQGQIDDRKTKVATYSDLPDAVTVQQRLDSLVTLHNQQVAFSRFFAVLQSVAPLGIAAQNIAVGSDNLLDVSGTAKTYDLVTKFAKALEASNTEIGPGASPTKTPFFTKIQLTSASSESSNGVSGVTFKLTTQMSTGVTTDAE